MENCANSGRMEILMKTILTVKGINKSFGKKKALENVDLTIQENEIVGLIGSNGAGKSTLINILVGLKKQNSGEFKFDFPGFSPKQDLGVMCQEVSMPNNLKVKEWLTMVNLFYKEPYTVQEVMVLAGIADLADKYAAKLSGGQKRRIQFALAVLGKPKMLFLDEPTAGMDLESRLAFWDQLQGMASKGTTVLLASHDLEEIECIVDRVIMIGHGKIILNQSMEKIKEQASAVVTIALGSLGEELKMKLQNFIGQHKNVQQMKDIVEFIPDDLGETVSKLLKMGLTYNDFEVKKLGLQNLVRKKIEGGLSNE